MPNFYVVRKNIIENVIVWDEKSEYNPGEDAILVSEEQQPDANIGWVMQEDMSFVNPEELTSEDSNLNRYARLRKPEYAVVGFANFANDHDAAKVEPPTEEYTLMPCPDENVEIGWFFNYETGDYYDPNNGS